MDGLIYNYFKNIYTCNILYVKFANIQNYIRHIVGNQIIR
jgi:hypothetical protein